MGDPGQSYVWKTLDSQVIDKTFTRKDGQQLAVMTTCIDSGGHFTREVYDYCKSHEFKRVWAIKGQGGSGVPFIQRPTKRNKAGTWLFMIGVDVGKDTVASRLKVDFEGQSGYCHFPVDDGKGYDPAYFDGITSEHRVIRHVKGQKSMYWEKIFSGARNEPFDLRNYASAALEILNPAMEEIKKQFDAIKLSEKPAQKIAKKRTGVVNKGVEI
jgi:phage terminase large subunit GpA-like protein